MANRVSQPLGPILRPVPNAITTKPSTVEASRCCCRKPHSGHRPTSGILQMNAMHSVEDSSNDSIPPTPHPSSSGTPPPSSGSVLLSDTPRKLSSSNGSVGTRQNKRREQIGIEIKDLKEELCPQCFFSNFFPGFDEHAYREKVASLPLFTQRKFELTSPSIISPSTRETWPIDSNKKTYYPHVARLLNEIVDHFKEIIDPNNCKTVRFITYDRSMAPNTPTSLKPDLLLVEEKFVNRDSLQWKDPIIPVEVKSDFWDALTQLGAYAREMLSARPGRQLCWAIYFNYLNSTTRIILFTPDRVHYTQPALIKTAEGYREMAKAVVALLSQPHLLTIGEDLSRDSSTKLLPNGDRLKILRTEFDGKSIVGRKTRVLSVVVVDKDGKGAGTTLSGHRQPPTNVRKDPPRSLNRAVFTPKAPRGPPSATGTPSSSRPPHEGSAVTTPEGHAPASSPAAAGPSSYRQHKTRSGTASSGQKQPAAGVTSSDEPNLQEVTSTLVEVDYTLKDHHQNPGETITITKGDPHLTIGDHLIIKESWPLLDRQDIEWDALRSCIGQFGVPEVVYRVVGKHPMPVKCTELMARVPQHIALKEKGVRLEEATSPKALLTALLHGIIGHFNLFQKDWLHRDVSIGNVLMLLEPVTKLPPTGLESLENLTECRGMLIDGDAMINVNPGRKPGSHRSCTLPFLSRRLVAAWKLGTKTFDQYFDDLESFAWVLLWALLEIAEFHKVATLWDQDTMEYLRKNDLASLAAGKKAIVTDLNTLSKDIDLDSPKTYPTSLLDPFIEILKHWFVLIETENRRGKAETLPSSEESTLLYKSFISYAMEKAKELPDAWPSQSDASS